MPLASLRRWQPRPARTCDPVPLARYKASCWQTAPFWTRAGSRRCTTPVRGLERRCMCGEHGGMYREPGRDVPVLGEFDVAVAGGGPAGCAAAIGAARRGARTILLEKDGSLGGSTVSQSVAVLLSTNAVA